MSVIQKMLVWTGVLITGVYFVSPDPSEDKNTLPEAKDVEEVKISQDIPLEDSFQSNIKETLPLVESKDIQEIDILQDIPVEDSFQTNTKEIPTLVERKVNTEIVIPVKEKSVVSIPVIDNESECHESYGGCLKKNAWDYDCAGGSGNGPNYTGKVRVFWYDEFGLDRDKDGWGCE